MAVLTRVVGYKLLVQIVSQIVPNLFLMNVLQDQEHQNDPKSSQKFNPNYTRLTEKK